MNVSEQATGLYSNGSKQWLTMFDVVSNTAQSHSDQKSKMYPD